MATVPFAPSYGTGQVVTAGTAAALTNLIGQDQQVCVTNLDAAEWAFVRVAMAGNATTADMVVMPGQSRVLTKADGITRISYYSTGTPDLHIITGNGWLT